MLVPMATHRVAPRIAREDALRDAAAVTLEQSDGDGDDGRQHRDRVARDRWRAGSRPGPGGSVPGSCPCANHNGRGYATPL